MENISNVFYRVLLFSDRVKPSLCRYIFTTYTSAEYCVKRYISMYNISDAKYQIIKLKVIDYEET